MRRLAADGPWLFFALVFGWTWLFWLLAAVMQVGAQSPAGRALVIAGLLGPMLGGIGFAVVAGDRAERRDYWSRLVDARRIAPRWWLVILLLAPCLMASAVLLAGAAGGDAVWAGLAARGAPYLAAPAALAPFLLHVAIYGPIPEELGWRGYALDRLQERWSAPMASLVLGVVWAAWHLPLFFIPGMEPHYSHGAASPWFWLFMIQVVAISLVYGRVFNATRRSTLAAIVLHATTNLSADLANVTDAVNLYATLLWVAAALAAGMRSVPKAG